MVAVDASGVLDLEYTALKMFAQVVERQNRAWRSTVADWNES